MKYGVLFSIVAALLAFSAITNGEWYLFLLWPAISFAVVGSGYVYFGPRIFGKSPGGTLSTLHVVFLLPFLLYAWAIWYVLRLVKRESAFDQLTDRIYIGRRLLDSEVPANIDHVIDLTCEFAEPNSLRSSDYHSFQILDAFAPTTAELESWVLQAAKLSGTIYIHCAEGHGRTGLFAAALLMKLGRCMTPGQALALIQSKRPLVRLGAKQRAVLSTVQPG